MQKVLYLIQFKNNRNNSIQTYPLPASESFGFKQLMHLVLSLYQVLSKTCSQGSTTGYVKRIVSEPEATVGS